MKTLIALLLCLPALAQSPFRFEQISPESLALTENGEPVYAYNHGVMLADGAPKDRARCCYVHPLHAPGGVVLTDDFPKDHYHHRGVFWVWPVVTIDGQRHDLWLMNGIRKRFERWAGRETLEDRAELAFENGWYVADKKVVRESVKIVARPARDRRREIEFALTFEATDRPVELRGDPTESKGYGGFCVRFAPRKTTLITSEEGREERDSNMKPLPWAQEEGEFTGGEAGLRIDIDPSKPGYPNGWCLRHYGFLGVNYPGNDAYTLTPGTPLELRYKVTVFSE